MVFINLIDSVSELLYKHNCVIIPEFGGFLTNFKHSGFEESRNIISPSSKKVAFNQSLIENDGLLTNSWAQRRNITYSEALAEVETFCSFLKDRIFNHKSFDFKNIGTFYLSAENKIIFVPYQGLNFLESSYGLFPVKIKALNVSPSLSIAPPLVFENEPEPIILEEQHIPKPYKKYLINDVFLKAASLIFLASIASFAIYFISISNSTKVVKNIKPTEQKASVFNLDTNKESIEKVIVKPSIELEIVSEKQKLQAIKVKLDSFVRHKTSTEESFNVILGYYPSHGMAQKIWQGVSKEYSHAVIGPKTDEGYCIVIENFYKHTTAEAFCVILKQNGYNTVKIEKQLVIEN